MIYHVAALFRMSSVLSCVLLSRLLPSRQSDRHGCTSACSTFKQCTITRIYLVQRLDGSLLVSMTYNLKQMKSANRPQRGHRLLRLKSACVWVCQLCEMRHTCLYITSVLQPVASLRPVCSFQLPFCWYRRHCKDILEDLHPVTE